MSHHHSHEHKHEHRGKTSEKYVDKAAVFKALGVREGQTVLDAGCGDGYMAKEFAVLVKNTGTVYAMDMDETAIDNLKKTIATDTIRPITGDISAKTSLGESSIDLIYISNVMHGFIGPQTAGFIAETQRLLKPGGRLAVLEFKKEETPHGPPLDIRISPAELKEQIPLTPGETTDIGEYFYLQIFRK